MRVSSVTGNAVYSAAELQEGPLTVLNAFVAPSGSVESFGLDGSSLSAGAAEESPWSSGGHVDDHVGVHSAFAVTICELVGT